ncbi:MAG: DUF3696 domain-containing protein [Clostridiales bacterium]|nr:DUF3696 domain-containing protein [Clostridiales bacterium]
MLREIYVKNFKCFEDFTLPLRQVNILSGMNGMGKSTMLQSILLIRQSFLQENVMKGLRLNGKYVSLGNAQDILYEKAEQEIIGLGFTDENQKIRWEYQYTVDSDYLPIIQHTDESDHPSIINGKVCCQGILGTRFTYISAYRIEPKDLYKVQNEKELFSREFGNNGEFALQYLGMYRDEEVMNPHVILEDRMGPSLLNQTRLWLNRISPGVSPQVIINMQQRNAEVRYEYIEGREKTQSYKSVNVGFGITYVLPLIVSILSAKENDIIVMENPEAHIHPSGQRMLGELIARAGEGGVQLIVETHSDHILNGVRLAVKEHKASKDNIELSYFYKESDDGYRHKCVYPHILSDGRLDCWPEGFFDEWDNTLLELL